MFDSLGVYGDIAELYGVRLDSVVAYGDEAMLCSVVLCMVDCGYVWRTVLVGVW